jgi:hypothetical protein
MSILLRGRHLIGILLIDILLMGMHASHGQASQVFFL